MVLVYVSKVYVLIDVLQHGISKTGFNKAKHLTGNRNQICLSGLVTVCIGRAEIAS